MNENDKYNFLLNKIEQIRNINNSSNLWDKEELIQLKNKVNELNNDLIQKNIIIKEMNEKINKIKDNEKKLKVDLNDKLNDFQINLINKIRNQNEIIII